MRIADPELRSRRSGPLCRTPDGIDERLAPVPRTQEFALAIIRSVLTSQTSTPWESATSRRMKRRSQPVPPYRRCNRRRGSECRRRSCRTPCGRHARRRTCNRTPARLVGDLVHVAPVARQFPFSLENGGGQLLLLARLKIELARVADSIPGTMLREDGEFAVVKHLRASPRRFLVVDAAKDGPLVAVSRASPVPFSLTASLRTAAHRILANPRFPNENGCSYADPGSPSNSP